MVRVLVTGGAGYIGSTLVPQLLRKGCNVTVLDTLVYGVNSLLSVCHHDNLVIVKGDILDEQVLQHAMDGADVIIHLAAIVGYPACAADPELAKRVNVNGTNAIVTKMKKNQQLIFASTGSCYGELATRCTEDMPINPISLYGQTKAEGEDMVRSVGGVVLRFSTLFGVAPRLRMDLLVNQFAMKAVLEHNLDIYEGHFMRSFIHVNDAATSFIFTMEHYDQMQGESFNIGNDDLNMTKHDLAKAVASNANNCKVTASTELTDLDKRNYAISFEKVSKLGYEANIGLQAGLNELFKVIPCFSEQELKTYGGS